MSSVCASKRVPKVSMQKRVYRTPRLLVLFVLSLLTAITFQVAQPQSAHAATPPDSCFNFNTGTQTIIRYYRNEGNNSGNPACPRDVDIPATIGGVPVRHIGDNSFRGSIGTTIATSFVLNSVTFPEGLETIGEQAFSPNKLTGSLVFPSTLTAIADFAFYTVQEGSDAPLSVVFSNSATATTIGDNAFTGCSSATYSLSEYGAFSTKIGSLDLGNAVTTIGDSGFCRSIIATTVDGIATLTIPASIASIGGQAFAGHRLTALVIPGTVASIGTSAFSNNQLASLTIHGNATINGSAFNNNQLTEVTITGNPVLGSTTVFASNGIASIPTGLTTEQRAAYRQANAEIVRIWASDPAFATAYPNNINTATVNSNTYITSAFITNPASLAVNYVDNQGNPVSGSIVVTGIRNLVALTGYRLSDLVGADFSQFYVAGQTIAVPLVTVDGYITPSGQSVMLALGQNVVNYVYLASSGGGDSDRLADTGLGQLLVVAGAFVVAIAGYSLVRTTSSRPVTWSSRR